MYRSLAALSKFGYDRFEGTIPQASHLALGGVHVCRRTELLQLLPPELVLLLQALPLLARDLSRRGRLQLLQAGRQERQKARRSGT